MTTTRPDPASVFTADELEGLVSVQRFASFRRATTDPAAAVALYAWNARVSGAFAELIQHVEVLVRNAMHRRLTAHHAQVSGRPPGKAWFDEPSWVRHHWFNKADRVKIRSAIGRAGHTSYRPDPGKVIAALNFGFWRYLASARYEQSLWVPALDNAFTAPGRDFGDRRRAVEHRLAYLHPLRNRISHCEPSSVPSDVRSEVCPKSPRPWSRCTAKQSSWCHSYPLPPRPGWNTRPATFRDYSMIDPDRRMPSPRSIPHRSPPSPGSGVVTASRIEEGHKPELLVPHHPLPGASPRGEDAAAGTSVRVSRWTPPRIGR